ncbi:hypothetical protein SpCBS45565_g06920 [Spizellomyces sp. 'palustris']|nr:hypothetical protein SpCBS45565_g06920 [Spizellomyces sp. 'palustris']
MPSILSRLKTLIPGPSKPPPPLIPRYKRPRPKTIYPTDFGGLDKPLAETEDIVIPRLPSEQVKPVQEYPQLRYKPSQWAHVRERGRRKMAFVLDKFTSEPGAMVLLGVTAGGVWGLGIYEALLNVKSGVPVGEVWRFVVRFAAANTFGALTNTSVAPETIVASLNLDPSLFNFIPHSPEALYKTLDPNQAEARLHAVYARVTRGLAAGYMGVASLLRVINWTFMASNIYRERVLSGREPPFLGVEGRVFRLCGRVSDTLTMSLARDGEHVLPIIEEPSNVRHLLQEYTRNGSVPMAWHIRENQYGSPQAWTGLVIDEPALLKTKSGERLLYIEADGTNSEDALRLGTESADLSLEDASAAYRMIEDIAHRTSALPSFTTVRVFLGDMLQKGQTGGGMEYTLRQRKVDILIDSKLPILTEIIKWADKIAAPGWQLRKVIFETDSQEYFHNLTALLKIYGFTVLDISQVSPEDAGKLPRLVYYRRTGSTVNAFRAILDADPIDPGRICVVIDTKDGLDTVQQLKSRGYLSGEETTIVCSSDIYDTLLRQVRTWCRMGYTPKQIQAELDAQNVYVAQVAKAIAQQAEDAKKNGELKEGEFQEDLAKKEVEDQRAKQDAKSTEKEGGNE